MNITDLSHKQRDAAAIADMLFTAVVRLDMFGPEVFSMVREYVQHNNGHGSNGDEFTEAVVEFLDKIKAIGDEP